MDTLNQKTKKILFVLPEFYPETGGGICTYYISLLRNLLNNVDWKITIVQGSAYEMQEVENKWLGVPIYHLSKSSFNTQKENFKHFSLMPEFQNHLASSWALYDLAKSLDINFDTVVTTDWGLGFVPWIIEGHTPTIVHLHGSIGQIDHYDSRLGMEFWSALYLDTESNLFNYAGALVTFSLQNITFWTERKVERNKFSLILPIIENNNLPQTKEKSEFFTGLVIGRIQYWKGVIQLCEAMALLTEQERAKLRIYWIGRDTFYHDSGTNMDDFLTTKFPTIWKKTILPIGSRTHEEIEDFYKKIDFSIVPSTWDLFNITAIEHLLHQKPLICSTGAGASDFLSESEDIYVFNNTAGDLADKLKVLLNKTEIDLATIGENGFHFTKKTFNTQNSVDEHINLINETIRTFKSQGSLAKKFTLLAPKESRTLDSTKEMMIQSWPLKEVSTIVLKSIAKKIFSRINLFNK